MLKKAKSVTNKDGYTHLEYARFAGYSETDRLKEALRLGATTYIKKPYLLEKIGFAVRAAEPGRRPQS